MDEYLDSNIVDSIDSDGKNVDEDNSKPGDDDPVVNTRLVSKSSSERALKTAKANLTTG